MIKLIGILPSGRFSIHSIFSAALLLSITALFREPKAREDLQLHPAFGYLRGGALDESRVSSEAVYTTCNVCAVKPQ
jgi:hypothetical protein